MGGIFDRTANMPDRDVPKGRFMAERNNIDICYFDAVRLPPADEETARRYYPWAAERYGTTATELEWWLKRFGRVDPVRAGS